jgi:DNA-binding NarL/FixJ family response regulator
MMTGEKRIRVVIADDHAGVRRGIRFLLRPFSDIVVEGEAENGQDAIKIVQQIHPDILLLDFEMPLMRGDEVARAIQALDVPTRILAISSTLDHNSVQSMKQNGAVGYLSKDNLASVLVNAIRKAAGDDPGWIGLKPELGQEDHSDRQTLTQREYSILHLLLEGHTEDEIANRLKLSQDAVKSYLEILLNKFGADTLAGLAKSARRRGIQSGS